MNLFRKVSTFLTLLFFILCTTTAFAESDLFVISKKGTSLRSEAAGGGEVIGTIPFGISITGLESKGEYSKVAVADYTGWVVSVDISENDPQAEIKGEVAALLNEGWFPIVDRYGEYVADWSPRDSFSYNNDRGAVELDIILEPVFYYISEITRGENSYSLKVYEHDPLTGDSWDLELYLLEEGEMIRFDGVVQGVYVKNSQADRFYKVSEKEQIAINRGSIKGSWLIDIFTTVELGADGKAILISHGDDIEGEWQLDSATNLLSIKFSQKGIRDINWELLYLHNEYLIIKDKRSKMIVPRSTY